MELGMVISVLLVGVIIVLAILVKYAFRLMSLPAITGYFILGFILKIVGEKFGLLTPISYEILSFLGSMGVIALLFRIGLESKLAELLRWLPQALFIWSGDILMSALLGFVAAYYLLNLELIPSLFVAAAFTPTSVGISVGVWEEMKKLKTREGEVMLDTSELDDLSGILIMGILFLVAPLLQVSGSANLTTVILTSVGWFLLKMLLFGAVCYLGARFAEQRLTIFLKRMHSGDSSMLVVVGIGLMVAALAGFIGFSVAIGAFFAGLIFSSDSDAVKIDASFEAIHELFVPFFFVGIGMAVDPAVLSSAGVPVLILLVAAIAGKLLGAGGAAAVTFGGSTGLLIGVSMIPRAEIALIIMERGLALGPWAVPPDLFAWIVIISATTAILMPLVLRNMMKNNLLKPELA